MRRTMKKFASSVIAAGVFVVLSAPQAMAGPVEVVLGITRT